MYSCNVSMPETAAAEYFQAADELNRRFPDLKPKVEAKTLMCFVLSRYDAKDICAQFDFALRVVSGSAEPPFNPVLN